MKILITGANGFIGSFVVEKALGRGWEVLGVVRKDSDLWRLQEIGFSEVRAINRYSEILEVMCDYKPDAVIHLAAYVKKHHVFDDAYILSDSIVSYTTVVLDAMRECGVNKLVYAGTSFEYGRDKEPHAISDSLRPYDLYAALKVAAEDVIRYYVDTYSLDAVVIRPFFVFGYRDNPNKLIPYMVRKALKGEEVDLTGGEQELDYIYVKDVADIFLNAAIADLRGFWVFNAGRGETITLRDMGRILEEIIGKTLPFRWGKRPYGDKEIMYLKADITAAVNYLKWRPSFDVRSGLEEVVAYYRDNL